MMTFFRKIAFTILFALILPGIAGAQVQTNPLTMADFDDAKWWTQFGDTILDRLIARGLEKNYDVLMAAKRIGIAQNTLRQTRSAYFPTLGISLGWNKERVSGSTSHAGTAAENLSYFNGGVSLSWEVDLFGRITARSRENKAQLRVSRAEYAATMVSLQAQIATTYFNLRLYQAELDIARKHAESQADVVRITQGRFDSGLTSKLDVAQAQTTYLSTVASIPQLENNVGTAISAIAVLLGEMPDALNELLSPSRPLPECTTLANFQIPMACVERRPDVVEARLNIDAMAAALGVAKKDYLPMLELTGSIGTEAHRAGDLFRKNSFTYSFVPTLSWTIFDGLSRRAGVQIAKENLEIEIDNYNSTLLNAFNEADNQMGNYFTELEGMESLKKVIEYASESKTLSLDLYTRGLGTFTNVDNSMISLLQYELTLVESHGAALNYLVALYKALGGGWDPASVY